MLLPSENTCWKGPSVNVSSAVFKGDASGQLRGGKPHQTLRNPRLCPLSLFLNTFCSSLGFKGCGFVQVAGWRHLLVHSPKTIGPSNRCFHLAAAQKVLPTGSLDTLIGCWASILNHPDHLCSSSDPKTHLEGNRQENLLGFPISIIPSLASFLINLKNTVQVLCCCQVKTPVGRALPSTSPVQCLKVMPVGNCGAGNLIKPCRTRDCVPYHCFSTHSAVLLGSKGVVLSKFPVGGTFWSTPQKP